jgi:DNA-directed RNA polymerase specialized sigma24 family protein
MTKSNRSNAALALPASNLSAAPAHARPVLDAVIRAHRGRLVQTAEQLLEHPAQDAEDVVQDVCLAVLEGDLAISPDPVQAFDDVQAAVPRKASLTDPEVTSGIVGVLRASGVRKQDLQDGIQDVYVKVLTAFGKGAAVPGSLGAMRALCVTVAKNHVIDERRRAAPRNHHLAGPCDPDEHTPLEYGVEQPDPVDAGRQLEVLAQLFRERRMPEHGVDILEGVACRCTHEEIAEELGITDQAVKGRLGTMRAVFRGRMVRLGMWPEMQPLHVLVSLPAAIARLREAA